MRISIKVALAVMSIGIVAEKAHAGGITFDSSAPTPGTYDQYDFSTSDAGGQDAQGYKLDDPGRPSEGQTFLVPSGATGVDLSSFSLRLLSYSDGGTDRTFEAQVVQIDGGTPPEGSTALVTSVLADDTATVAAGKGPNIDPNDSSTAQWLTFTFDVADRPILTPGATYGFTLHSTDSGGNKYADIAYTVDTTYADGNAFSIDQGQSPDSEYAYGRPYDRQFEADFATAAPEPATISTFGLSVLALLARRRIKK